MTTMDRYTAEYLNQPRATQPRTGRLSYDAARVGTDLDNHWALADRLDADSANNRTVRHRLMQRSRYEEGSNGYYSGILRTHTNMIIGTGPSLRMQTGNTVFNRLVEREWYKWSVLIGLRRKLWAMGHGRWQDGESFGVMVTNPSLLPEVALDLIILEAEQCQTPMLPYGEFGYIDGIKFDRYGNPVSYDILPEHPGSPWLAMTLQPEVVPAAQVLHWFKLKRAGQHRSVPDCTSTLTLGAISRRWREATVASAETAASISVLLKSQMSPTSDREVSQLEDGFLMEVERRMAMGLPYGWDALQMKSEHPNSTYGDFNRANVSELARPISQPYNAAACDSSTYSFASGKLDTICYRAELSVERADCEELVLDPLFAAWFSEWTIVASRRDIIPDHTWNWPAQPVYDSVAEGKAADLRLRNGSLTLRRYYADMGLDLEDELINMAEDYGVSVNEMRKILLATIFPTANATLAPVPEISPRNKAAGDDAEDGEKDDSNEAAADGQEQ